MSIKKMNVLILCTYKSTYVIQLYKYVKKYYPTVMYSIFTQDGAREYYQENLRLADGEKIYSFGYHDYLCYIEAMKLPHFHIIHSLWMEHFWGECAGILWHKCDAWFCSVGGSDLYRESKHKLWFLLQKRIIKRASWISSEGEETKNNFRRIYGNKYDSIPHTVIRFGVDILESLKQIKTERISEFREKYGLPNDKVIIMCGTNARLEQQHIEMISAVERLPDFIKENCCLLIPMTYGGTEDYIKKIKERASGSIKSVILYDFLTTDEMAEVAMITDILIHVQTTDQLSSAMMAHMYCGNVVIAGSWLPYQELKDLGIGFVSVDKVSDITNQLEEIIPNINRYKEMYKVNEKLVNELSSWEHSAQEWYKVYDNLARKGASI